MPILKQQQRMRELGRLRMGEKKGGKGFPSSLLTWRLTSPSRKLIDAVAEKYGGTVTEWKNDKKPGKQWQVTTETDTLEVLVPPGDVGSYWMEMWSGDGCTRRCDRVNDTITGKPCDCPEDDEQRREKAKNGRACKPITRLSVLLKGIPEVGLWRLQSGGENASIEMQSIAKVCEVATLQNRMVPAELRVEPRTSKQPGQPTSHFVVPVLDIGYSLDGIMAALGYDESEPFPTLAAPARPLELPERRPDLPPDPAFLMEQGSGSTEVPPATPPVPGPAPEIDSDDDVAEAEIVVEVDGVDGDPAASTAEADGETSRNPEPSTPDESDWSARTWRTEMKARGVSQRALVTQARDIAEQKGLDETITKIDHVLNPAIAPELRVWLNLQGA